MSSKKNLDTLKTGKTEAKEITSTNNSKIIIKIYK